MPDELASRYSCHTAYATRVTAIICTPRCSAGLPLPYRPHKPSTVEPGMQPAHCRNLLVMSMLWVCQHHMLAACQMRYKADAKFVVDDCQSHQACSVALPAKQQARACQHDGCMSFLSTVLQKLMPGTTLMPSTTQWCMERWACSYSCVHNAGEDNYN